MKDGKRESERRIERERVSEREIEREGEKDREGDCRLPLSLVTDTSSLLTCGRLKRGSSSAV